MSFILNVVNEILGSPDVFSPLIAMYESTTNGLCLLT
jgi:hypothetical protein